MVFLMERSNSLNLKGTPKAKAVYWLVTDVEVLRHGYQIGLDTLVVHMQAMLSVQSWLSNISAFKLTLKHSAWELRSQDQNSKELAGSRRGSGACGLI